MNRIPHSSDNASPTVRERIGPLHLYVAALTTVAIGIAAMLILVGQPIGSIWIVLILALAAAVAERGSVRLTDTTELSISQVMMLFAAVLFGPLAGGIVGAEILAPQVS